MPRNIEIKATAHDWPAQWARAVALAGPPSLLPQVDRFFACRHGRLKLRTTEHGSELIAYDRPDAAEPKPSQYLRCPVADPEALAGVLSSALGDAGTVRKCRHLFLVDGTRIHFDEVEGLGRFIELEVPVDAEAGRDSDGVRTSQRLMSALDIREQDLVVGAYLDQRPTDPGD